MKMEEFGLRGARVAGTPLGSTTLYLTNQDSFSGVFPTCLQSFREILNCTKGLRGMVCRSNDPNNFSLLTFCTFAGFTKDEGSLFLFDVVANLTEEFIEEDPYGAFVYSATYLGTVLRVRN